MPKMSQNSRAQGIEWRAMKNSLSYVVGHPRTLTTSTMLTASVVEFGPVTTGSVLGATAAAGFCLYRAAPRTWDRTIGPSVSAWWRRWTFYQRRWARTMNGCDLSKLDKESGEIRTPRLRKVRVRGS